MNAVNIKLYNILKNDLRLSEAKAKVFIEAVHEIVAIVKAGSTGYKSIMKEDMMKLEPT
jgi:hypothetical protein